MRTSFLFVICIFLTSYSQAQQPRGQRPPTQTQPQPSATPGAPAPQPGETASAPGTPEGASHHPPAGAASEAAPQSAPGGRFPAPPAIEKLSTTQHVINVNGARIPYTAVAGTLVLKKDGVTPIASMFFVS